MKLVLTFLAMLVGWTAAAQRTPLRRAYLQTDLDANGLSITNLSGWSTTNMYDVRSLGAKGDGVTDDYATLQGLMSKSFAVYYFPRGTYVISSNLVLPYRSHLIGEGVETTIIRPRTNFLGTALIDTSTWYGVGDYMHYSSIQNVALYGVATNTSVANDVGYYEADYGVRVLRAGEIFSIRNVFFNFFDKSAIWAAGAHASLTLDTVSIQYVKEYGLALTAAPEYSANVPFTNFTSGIANGAGTTIARTLSADHCGLGVVGGNCNFHLMVFGSKVEQNNNAIYNQPTMYLSSSNIVTFTTNTVCGVVADATNSPLIQWVGGYIQHDYTTNAAYYPNFLGVDAQPTGPGVQLLFDGVRYTCDDNAVASFYRQTYPATNFPMGANREVFHFNNNVRTHSPYFSVVSLRPEDNGAWAVWSNRYDGAIVKLGTAGSSGYSALSFSPAEPEAYSSATFAALWGNSNVTALNVPNAASPGEVQLRAGGTTYGTWEPRNGLILTNKAVGSSRAIWMSPTNGVRQYYTDGNYVSLSGGATLNAMDYGATGADVTDDTVALQAALTAAAGTKAGTVYIPPGTYYLTNVLVVPYGVNILGGGSERQGTASQSLTALQQTADTNCLVFQWLVSQWIQDIALRGPSNVAYGGIVITNGIGDLSPPGEQFHARNVSVRGFGYAVITASPSVTVFENCYLYGCMSGIGLHLGYVDTVVYRSCNLGYGTNAASINGSVPIFTTTEQAQLKNFLVENCEVGNSNPVFDSAGGGTITFRNCNFERIGYQAGAPTNAFVLRGWGAAHESRLLLESCRIIDSTNALALVAGVGEGRRWVSYKNNSVTLATTAEPVALMGSGSYLLYDEETPIVDCDIPNGLGYFDGKWRKLFNAYDGRFHSSDSTPALTVTNFSGDTALAMYSGPEDVSTFNEQMQFILSTTNTTPLQFKVGWLGSTEATNRGAWIQTSESGSSDDRVLVLQRYGGRVAIGQTNATSALDVAGTITADIINCDTNNTDTLEVGAVTVEGIAGKTGDYQIIVNGDLTNLFQFRHGILTNVVAPYYSP